MSSYPILLDMQPIDYEKRKKKFLIDIDLY